MPNRPRVRLLNIHFDDVTMEDVLQLRQGTILTAHVDAAVKLQDDREFHDLLDRFDVITCDSQILYFAAKLLRRPLRERVSGSDYFPLFYRRYADDPSVTIFLCGAIGDIAQRAMRTINEKVGREMVVGAYGPRLGWLEDPAEIDRVIAMINESGASVLVVGVGTPNEGFFIHRYRDQLPAVRLFLPLGGTIDYEAGAVRRPPPVVTRLGLEWLWRLVLQPRRRWKRYLVHQPRVFYYLALDAVGRYRDPFA